MTGRAARYLRGRRSLLVVLFAALLLSVLCALPARACSSTEMSPAPQQGSYTASELLTRAKSASSTLSVVTGKAPSPS